jgi:putative molybdopterin biosynthesis protein
MHSSTELFTTRDVASYLQINEKMVYSLIAEKGLPATKITGKWLFPKHLVDQWIEAHTSNLTLLPKDSFTDKNLLILTGSNDILLERLLAQYNLLNPGHVAAFGNMGSMGGIKTLKKGLCDIATSHLIQEDEREYNFAFVKLEFNPPPAVVNFCRREQGILLQPGNPKGIQEIADLGNKGVRIVNRAVSTGTRLLLDKELAKCGLKGEKIVGYDDIRNSHMDVGLDILQGKADAGLGIRPVASLLGLDFKSLRWERYDFLINRQRFFSREVQQFLGILNEPFFQKTATAIPGYDISTAGRILFPNEEINKREDTPSDH